MQEDCQEPPVFFEHSSVATPLKNVHSQTECYAANCTLHNRSDHHLRHLPQWWNSDDKVMERECRHGITHTDPDERPGYEIHPCDGCCVEIKKGKEVTKSLAMPNFRDTQEFEAIWAVEGLVILYQILEDLNPSDFVNTGSYDNYLFSFNSYCWCDGEKEGHEKGCPPNFIFKNSGVEINWYKHIGRGISANIDELSPLNWYLILNACIMSLRGNTTNS